MRQSFFLPKQSQKSRSILDGSRPLGLFRKGKTYIIAKFNRTDLVICSNSGEGKTTSYSQINMVIGRIILELSSESDQGQKLQRTVLVNNTFSFRTFCVH